MFISLSYTAIIINLSLSAFSFSLSLHPEELSSTNFDNPPCLQTPSEPPPGGSPPRPPLALLLGRPLRPLPRLYSADREESRHLRPPRGFSPSWLRPPRDAWDMPSMNKKRRWVGSSGRRVVCDCVISRWIFVPLN